jgi:hypothetical protein
MEALTLFNVLFSDLSEKEYIEVSVHEHGDHQPRRVDFGFYRSTTEATQFIEKYQEGHNVWFGVLPRKKELSTREGVGRLNCIYVDLDLPPAEGHKKIKDFLLPATAIVHSGRHLQIYYKLKEAVDQTVFDKLMDQISAWYGVDSLKNINRLFRVPGTQHVKDINKPLLCTLTMPGCGIDASAVYSAKDLFAAVNISSNFRKMALSKRVPSNYKTPDGLPDRSRRDFAVIKHFQKHGLSDETIRLIAHRLPFGERYREQRGNALIDYDISASANEARLKKASATLSRSSFREEPNGYYFNDTQVSTFTLHPTSVVESSDGDVIICDVKANGRTWHNVAFERHAFVGAKEFMTALSSISWQWLGSPQQFKFLLPYLDALITENDIPRRKGIDHTGYVDGYFVSDDQIISVDGLVDDFPYVLLGHKRETIHTKWLAADSDKLFSDIMTHLPHMNKPHIVWLMFGWFMAAPFKQALWDDADKARFPILNSFGEQGAGKSSGVVEVFQRLLGLNELEWTASSTDFNVLKQIHASNAAPLIVSEFRVTNTAMGAKFMEYLRGLYMNAQEGKGQTDGSTIKYKLHRPFVLTGEDGITDPATKERSIRLQYSKTWLLKNSKAKEAFLKLKKLPLEQFSLPYLKFVLQTIKEREHVALYNECVEYINKHSDEIPDRVQANMAMVWFGLEVVRKFLDELMPALDFDTVFKEYLDELLGRSTRMENMADQFITDVINEYFMYLDNVTTKPKFSCRYEPEPNTFWFRLPDAISWWTLKRRNEGQPILTKQAIQQQLEEADYYTEKKVHNLRGCSNFLHGINIKRANSIGLDIPDSLPETELVILYENKHS